MRGIIYITDDILILQKRLHYAAHHREEAQNSVSKGHTTRIRQNACLDPIASSIAAKAAETGEYFIVRVDSKNGGHYWFSDRRVLREEPDGIQELLRYKDAQRIHWMFKDVFKDPRMLSQPGELKRKYYDRLEIEVQNELVVLEGLDQAYGPILNFFQWIVPSRSSSQCGASST